MNWPDLLQQWLREQKILGGGCCRCGERDPECLDFHHIDPKTKRFTIGNGTLSARERERLGQAGDYLTCLSVGLGDLQREIAKCVLICANCHRKFHAHVKRGGDSPFWKWDPSMLKDAPRSVAAARRGIQRRRERGLPEPILDYGIDGDTQRKYLNLMLKLQREVVRREAEGDPVITAYSGGSLPAQDVEKR